MAQSDSPEDNKMPLLDHLIELRNRLMYSVGALLVAFVFCYVFAADIFRFLLHPLMVAFDDPAHRRMIFTAPHEAFFTYVRVAFFSATFLSFPIVAMQMWKFVAPGLYRNERHAFLPFLVATPILFFLGGAMVYFLVAPVAFEFFLSFETGGEEGGLPIQLEARVREYLSLMMTFIFAFGLCFQLPVVLTLLSRAGIASADGLARWRKYGIIIAFAAAAFLTPPDPFSQVALALPILVMYEISIWLARATEKRRARREAEEEAAEAEAEAAGDSTGGRPT